MEQSSEYREQLLESYKQAVRPLLPYLPWLEQSAGKRASSIYSGQDIGVNSVSFPVYDGTLLNFVREATKSPLMDRNYAYVYTRHRIRTHQEERDIIQKAGWKEYPQRNPVKICLRRQNKGKSVERGGIGADLLSGTETDAGDH